MLGYPHWRSGGDSVRLLAISSSYTGVDDFAYGRRLGTRFGFEPSFDSLADGVEAGDINVDLATRILQFIRGVILRAP